MEETSPTRAELEKRIIEKAWKVNVSKPQGSWLDDQEFQDLLDAWWDLKDYYAGHADDSVIGVEVLREYLHFTRLLRRYSHYDEFGEARQEQAIEAVELLENILGDIITEVVTYLDSVERGIFRNQESEPKPISPPPDS